MLLKYRRSRFHCQPTLTVPPDQPGAHCRPPHYHHDRHPPKILRKTVHHLLIDGSPLLALSIALIYTHVVVSYSSCSATDRIPRRDQEGTHRCDTTDRRASARRHKMKRMQSVQVVNSRIKGMLPMGCGFGDLCGSVNEICESQGMFFKICTRTSCRCHCG